MSKEDWLWISEGIEGKNEEDCEERFGALKTRRTQLRQERQRSQFFSLSFPDIVPEGHRWLSPCTEVAPTPISVPPLLPLPASTASNPSSCISVHQDQPKSPTPPGDALAVSASVELKKNGAEEKQNEDKDSEEDEIMVDLDQQQGAEEDQVLELVGKEPEDITTEDVETVENEVEKIETETGQVKTKDMVVTVEGIPTPTPTPTIIPPSTSTISSATPLLAPPTLSSTTSLLPTNGVASPVPAVATTPTQLFMERDLYWAALPRPLPDEAFLGIGEALDAIQKLMALLDET